MKVDKKIKDMPWPDVYEGGNQDFMVSLSWPVIDHERLLVATFVRNRNKKMWRQEGPSFRLVCSKKNGTAAILFKGDRAAKRKKLNTALDGFGTYSTYCYPEISPADEKALGKWLREDPNQSRNHLMPELDRWVEEAIGAEILRERDARGELRDEDVYLCPEELPAGLVDHIVRNVLPNDNTLVYKKGNVRGTCFLCREKVHAKDRRFRQGESAICPNCSSAVHAVLQGGVSFSADYVADVATLQKGTDGKTLFVRQWHLVRDQSAKWENIPAYLEEVARYAVRGNKAAKWQHEAKENMYMHPSRYRLKNWTRVRDVSSTYDGQYFFYLPMDWEEQLSGTSLQYCDLKGYYRSCDNDKQDRTTVRFLMDWARYPVMEKFWKAGYTGLVHERLCGVGKDYRYAVIWTRPDISTAIRFPKRFLKILPPKDWTCSKMHRAVQAWELVQSGTIRERELEELVRSNLSIDMIREAMPHASVHKIVSYIDKCIAAEKAAWPPNAPSYRTPQSVITYRDYLKDCRKLNWDLDDRAILFPRNLPAAHERTISLIKYEENKAADEKFRITREKQLWMEWQHGDFLIRLPVDAHEIVAEGKALKHCVGGYVQRAADGKTTILFIRRVDQPDKPFYTLEWCADRVQQCMTYKNSPYRDDPEVVAFVDAWKKIHKKLKSKARKVEAA